MQILQTTFPQVLLGLLVSAVIALVFVRVAIFLTNRFGILDRPGSSPHKKHKVPTPLAGGITIALTFATLFFLFPSYFSGEAGAILFATAIVFVFGLIDDAIGLDAKWKFFGQTLAALALILMGVQISFFSWLAPEINQGVNLLITVFWLVGLSNAFNLVDSTDGLSLSLGAITCVLLIFASLISMQASLVFLSACLLGAMLGLLFYNLPPARIFMGDSGVQSLGFFLGSLSILYNPVIQPQEASWFVPVTLLAVPIFDVGLVTFSRLRHRAPLFEADLNHTYHRLAAKGIPHLKSLWTMDMAALFAGSVGLYALYQEPLTANLIFLGLLMVGGFLVIRLAK